MNAPGSTMIHTGSDLAATPAPLGPVVTDPPEGICEKEAFVVIAENGDIQLKAANGKVRIEGNDIEFVANGNAPHGVFYANANESIKLDSKNVTIDGKQSLKLISTGLITISGGLSTQIFSPLIYGVTAATVAKALPVPGKMKP